MVKRKRNPTSYLLVCYARGCKEIYDGWSHSAIGINTINVPRG